MAWHPVQLGWFGRMCAFWTLFWPGWLISVILLIAFPGQWQDEALKNHQFLMSLCVNIFGLCLQVVPVPRLLWKAFRSFRVVAIRRQGMATFRLSLFEIVMIGARILWPQIILLAVTMLLSTVATRTHNPELARSLPGFILSLRVLIIGPLCISLALPDDYGSFRLETYGPTFGDHAPR